MFREGEIGETYNVGGNSERRNIDIIHDLCRIVAEETGAGEAELRKLITFVKDRPGHDLRYAIDATKIRDRLGWEPQETFDSGLRKTVRWYLDSSDWVQQVRSGEYREWIERQYSERGEAASG